MCCAKLRNVIWKLFEDPNSSSAAKVITGYYQLFLTVMQVLVIVSSLFLLASIIMLILSTVPEFQVHFSFSTKTESVGKIFNKEIVR